MPNPEHFLSPINPIIPGFPTQFTDSFLDRRLEPADDKRLKNPGKLQINRRDAQDYVKK